MSTDDPVPFPTGQFPPPLFRTASGVSSSEQTRLWVSVGLELARHTKDRNAFRHPVESALHGSGGVQKAILAPSKRFTALIRPRGSYNPAGSSFGRLASAGDHQVGVVLRRRHPGGNYRSIRRPRSWTASDRRTGF